MLTNLWSHDIKVVQPATNKVADFSIEQLLLLVPLPLHQLQHGDEQIQLLQCLGFVDVFFLLSIICDPYRCG